jgi:hypothetical protein
MLIIDEAHKLSDDSLEVLREIHDATGCPVFCLATKELSDRVERSADPDAGQLYSRFNVRYPLTLGFDVKGGGKPLHTVEQIRQLYEQKPIKLSTDAVHYLLEVSNNLGFGSLRRCKMLMMNAVRQARKRAGAAAGDTVTVTAGDIAHMDKKLCPQSFERQEISGHKAAKASALAM